MILVLSSTQTGQNKRETSTASPAPLAIPANKSNKQQLQSRIKQLTARRIGWLVLQFVFSCLLATDSSDVGVQESLQNLDFNSFGQSLRSGIWNSQMHISRLDWGLPGGGGIARCSSRGTEFQLCKMNEFWKS